MYNSGQGLPVIKTYQELIIMLGRSWNKISIWQMQLNDNTNFMFQKTWIDSNRQKSTHRQDWIRIHNYWQEYTRLDTDRQNRTGINRIGQVLDKNRQEMIVKKKHACYCLEWKWITRDFHEIKKIGPRNRSLKKSTLELSRNKNRKE